MDGTLYSPACSSSMWFTNRFDICMSSEFCNTGLIAEIAVQIMLSPLLMLFTIFSWIVFSLKIYILYGVNMRFRLCLLLLHKKHCFSLMVLKSDLKLTLFKYTVSYDETLPNENSRHCKIYKSACFLKAFLALSPNCRPELNSFYHKLIMQVIAFKNNCNF